MSANNMWFAHEKDNTWYGWDITAEETIVDHENGASIVNLKHPTATGTSIADLAAKLADNSPLGYAEYGLTTQPYLAKDGFPIKVIEEPTHED